MCKYVRNLMYSSNCRTLPDLPLQGIAEWSSGVTRFMACMVQDLTA